MQQEMVKVIQAVHGKTTRNKYFRLVVTLNREHHIRYALSFNHLSLKAIVQGIVVYTGSFRFFNCCALDFRIMYSLVVFVGRESHLARSNVEYRHHIFHECVSIDVGNSITRGLDSYKTTARRWIIPLLARDENVLWVDVEVGAIDPDCKLRWLGVAIVLIYTLVLDPD